MIRVGIIADSFEIGGQERGCLEILRRLDRRRFAPSLYLFRPGSLLAEARALGIPIVVGYEKPGVETEWTKADDDARVAWRERLGKRLRRDGIDVCLIYAWKDGIDAAHAAGVRAIVERLDGPALATRIRDKSACQRIICESRVSRDVMLAQRELVHCTRRQVVVVRNGVDLVRFDPARYDRDTCRARLGLRPDDFVVGAVGRLSPEKNFTQLLHAARFIIDRSRQASRVQVVIAGPERGDGAALAEACRRLDITDRVQFLGTRGDVPEVLRALDVYVLSSFYEGTPFSVLEAMAMALPIVATQVGGVIEVIRGNGYLVPVLRSEETGRALVDLIESPALVARLGRRSRRVALRHHSLDEMVRRYEKVLIDALDETEARVPEPEERAS